MTNCKVFTIYNNLANFAHRSTLQEARGPGALAGQEDLQEPQNPTGLQGLAGGVAGIGGLPSGGQEE